MAIRTNKVLNEQVSLLTLQNNTLYETLVEAKKLNDTLRALGLDYKRSATMNSHRSKGAQIPYRLSK